jgi:hypothetical protein
MARRHESLIPLSHDHHDALLLAWRLRTGDLSKREPELRASHVSAFFEYRLINHLKVEEELLFPAVGEVLGRKPLRSRLARTTRWTVFASCSNAISGPRSVNCSCWRKIG